ncbi:hypothetical protein PPTG_24605 [Phytophthora nicotianae INRA-310]|uniref:Uncharacterized protein n=2 Tax=Phytophthora nicotianae TaxID=4792 RepID=W2PCE4_PHYN3|nr:hypothetical protein PPTG_24605 [Phytophthora nicotianae INRA-310]ETM98511.1 hypothetical protein PPTG_24605 [Phytophthora nicotianae INRA-310]
MLSKSLVCKHCLAAYGDKARNNDPPAPKIVVGRATSYTNHLKRCKFYQDAVKRGVVAPPQVPQKLLRVFLQKNAAQPSTVVEEALSTSSNKRQRLIREHFDNVFSEDELEEFERLLIQFQADNCLPDRFVEKLSTLRLFIFLNKACARGIPKSKQMTRILDKHSNVEEEGQLLALSSRLEFSGGPQVWVILNSA